MVAVYIVIAVVVLAIVWWVASYNGLIRSRNQVDEAWSDIDVQLKRRHDLIPNLVESVKGYIQQEKSVLEDVARARSDAIAAGSQGTAEKSQAENALSQTLRSLFAVTENYPELKSSENFQQLSAQLTDTEDKILAARRFYNANVLEFNTKQQTFPTSIIAGSMGLAKREFFTLDQPEDRENVQVKF